MHRLNERLNSSRRYDPFEKPHEVLHIREKMRYDYVIYYSEVSFVLQIDLDILCIQNKNKNCPFTLELFIHIIYTFPILKIKTRNAFGKRNETCGESRIPEKRPRVGFNSKKHPHCPLKLFLLVHSIGN